MPVVVGYVDSAEGRAALDAAVAESARRDLRVIVVLSGQRTATSPSEDEAADRVREALDTAGLRHEIRHTARSGDVAEDIVSVAREEDAALVVIGLRRRSAVGRLFLGTKSQRILLDAPCPVLVVKVED